MLDAIANRHKTGEQFAKTKTFVILPQSELMQCEDLWKTRGIVYCSQHMVTVILLYFTFLKNYVSLNNENIVSFILKFASFGKHICTYVVCDNKLLKIASSQSNFEHCSSLFHSNYRFTCVVVHKLLSLVNLKPCLFY